MWISHDGSNIYKTVRILEISEYHNVLTLELNVCWMCLEYFPSQIWIQYLYTEQNLHDPSQLHEDTHRVYLQQRM